MPFVGVTDMLRRARDQVPEGGGFYEPQELPPDASFADLVGLNDEPLPETRWGKAFRIGRAVARVIMAILAAIATNGGSLAAEAYRAILAPRPSGSTSVLQVLNDGGQRERSGGSGSSASLSSGEDTDGESSGSIPVQPMNIRFTGPLGRARRSLRGYDVSDDSDGGGDSDDDFFCGVGGAGRSQSRSRRGPGNAQSEFLEDVSSVDGGDGASGDFRLVHVHAEDDRPEDADVDRGWGGIPYDEDGDQRSSMSGPGEGRIFLEEEPERANQNRTRRWSIFSGGEDEDPHDEDGGSGGGGGAGYLANIWSIPHDNEQRRGGWGSDQSALRRRSVGSVEEDDGRHGESRARGGSAASSVTEDEGEDEESEAARSIYTTASSRSASPASSADGDEEEEEFVFVDPIQSPASSRRASPAPSDDVGPVRRVPRGRSASVGSLDVNAVQDIQPRWNPITSEGEQGDGYWYDDGGDMSADAILSSIDENFSSQGSSGIGSGPGPIGDVRLGGDVQSAFRSGGIVSGGVTGEIDGGFPSGYFYDYRDVSLASLYPDGTSGNQDDESGDVSDDDEEIFTSSVIFPPEGEEEGGSDGEESESMSSLSLVLPSSLENKLASTEEGLKAAYVTTFVDLSDDDEEDEVVTQSDVGSPPEEDGNSGSGGESRTDMSSQQPSQPGNAEQTTTAPLGVDTDSSEDEDES